MTTSGAAADDRGTAGLEELRQLLGDVRRQVTAALAAVDALDARVDGLLGPAPAAAPTFARPAPVPPRRMEQMTRTPEPTADLDDLVDVLAPRLLTELVPALRDALREVR